MSADETFTHKAFYNRKVNAVHSLPDCVRETLIVLFIQQMSVALFSETGREF